MFIWPVGCEKIAIIYTQDCLTDQLFCPFDFRTVTMDAIQAANTAFSVDLFKKLCELDKNANFIFTPLCISTSLALAYKAANGDTATQMKQVGCLLLALTLAYCI